ncbi:MAG: histidine--tRNA ligase [Candidatus Asgardarchaeia archaeon]
MKKKQLKTVKGMRDFLPEDMIRREFIFDTIRKTYENYGFLPFETPALEYLEVLTAKSGSEITQQIYSFTDKGGREVGLRFDLTVPLARVIASNPALPKPFKRYCISRVWRYENPQAGRYREFWQADADIIGVESRFADVEVIAAARTALKRLGFRDFEIRVNSRKLLDAIAESIGIMDNEKKLELFRIIDKLDKIGENGVRNELKRIGVKDSDINIIFRYLSIRGPIDSVLENLDKVLDSNLKSAKEGYNDLIGIKDFAEYYHISNELNFDMSLARGLDYYTGPIFEISSRRLKIGSIAGGGRYDTLIELLGGPSTPAVGIALGVERIFEIMKKTNMFPFNKKTVTQVYVVTTNTSLVRHAISIAQLLRDSKINTEIDIKGRTLKKNLEIINKLGIPVAIIIGEKEIKENKVIIRDMLKNEQELINLDKLIDKVKTILLGKKMEKMENEKT